MAGVTAWNDKGGRGMAGLCLVVQTGPYTFENIDTAIGLARAALGAGHQVSLFLYVDGVVNANWRVDPPGERNIPHQLVELVAAGATIATCGACAKFRGIGKDLHAEGLSMGSLVDMADMISDADVVVNLGF